MPNKNILLIEPGYKNKYPPLGLMKIAQYHGPNGKNDNITFIKGEDKSVEDKVWDRIYITTLFSFEWSKISETIDYASRISNQQHNTIFVGGIAASLMKEKFLAEDKWRGIRIISGLLHQSPSQALELDEFEEELYSDDHDSTPIEDLIPDYSILEQIDYEYPVHNAYFAYATRGCVRKCAFCGVPKLEGAMREMPPLSKIVSGIEKLYGPKKDLILMDNNVVASPRLSEIIDEIVDLGFGPNATMVSPKTGKTVKRRVDFNQGVDARILAKSEHFMKQLSRICLSPLRIAFDHVGLMKPYVQAVRYASASGLNFLSNYMLYNFHDTPNDLFQRMRINVTLNEELGTKIYSFPMRYQPTDRPDRGFVGKNWNRHYLRSMQVILQATHGVVSGAPDFFKKAFGDTEEEYIKILRMPHKFIFNRDWYEFYDGRAEYDEFFTDFKKLNDEEISELMTFLSVHKNSEIDQNLKYLDNPKIKNITSYYKNLSVDDNRVIWDKQKSIKSDKINLLMTNDEIVEDAGLDHDPEKETIEEFKRVIQR
jgi:hypothetical protein